MGVLADVFAPSPKAKVLEALFRLGPIPVTRGELAREAGLYRTTTNRVLPDLIGLDLIRVERAGGEETIRANFDAPAMRLLAHLGSALNYVGVGEDLEAPSESQMAGLLLESRRQLIAPLAIAGRLNGPSRDLPRRVNRSDLLSVRELPAAGARWVDTRMPSVLFQDTITIPTDGHPPSQEQGLTGSSRVDVAVKDLLQVATQ